MSGWKPRASDVNWMRQHFRSLAVGGVWSYRTEPIIFKKEDEKTFALVIADESFPGVVDQIQRNKLVMAEAGITFVDRRSKKL